MALQALFLTVPPLSVTHPCAERCPLPAACECVPSVLSILNNGNMTGPLPGSLGDLTGLRYSNFICVHCLLSGMRKPATLHDLRDERKLKVHTPNRRSSPCPEFRWRHRCKSRLHCHAPACLCVCVYVCVYVCVCCPDSFMMISDNHQLDGEVPWTMAYLPQLLYVADQLGLGHLLELITRVNTPLRRCMFTPRPCVQVPGAERQCVGRHRADTVLHRVLRRAGLQRQSRPVVPAVPAQVTTTQSDDVQTQD